jgi:hypothetical protein
MKRTEHFGLNMKAFGEILAGLSEAERHEVFETSRLTGEPLARLWRMSDMQGPPPESILIEVRRSDIDRLIRELKRERRKKG